MSNVLFFIGSYYGTAQNNVKTWASLRESFEEYVIQLHYTLQDEIDKGSICLFANKSDPNELFAVLHNLDEEY
ncbi:hypothetical protein Glove_40g70 [Diversispora epigaea]|uniref:Uncharacterized protein n=1 Tax=Diversispora epigaea TaxID=1348612 RepID=A0A397JHT6_9GLOM|nr:hypothetical protein Glove_40g70 [Diversispora epigaea]